jgi:hypothetical protein
MDDEAIKVAALSGGEFALSLSKEAACCRTRRVEYMYVNIVHETCAGLAIAM